MFLFSSILIVVVILAIVSMRRDVVAFTFFIVLLSFGFEFIVNKLAPQMTYYVYPSIMAIVLAGMLYFFTRKKEKDYPGLLHDPFLRWFLVTSLFLVIVALTRGVSPLNYFADYRRVITGYLLLSLFLFMPSGDHRLRASRLLLALFTIEIIVGLIQFSGPDVVARFLYERNDYLVNGELFTLQEDIKTNTNLINGTLSRFNVYGNAICLLSIYFLGLLFRKGKEGLPLSRVMLSMIIIFGITALLLSGNKMSLFSLVIGLLSIIAIKNVKRFIIVFGILLFIIFLYQGVLQDIGTTSIVMGDAEREGPFDRILGIFAVLDNPFEVGGTFTTFTLTVVMIPYVFSNPLLGVGLYYRGGYPFIFPGSENETDATIAYLLSEFGIIGLVIYVSILIAAIRMLKKMGHKESAALILPVFIAASIQTITDAGVFSKITSFLLVFMIGIEILYGRYMTAAKEKGIAV